MAERRREKLVFALEKKRHGLLLDFGWNHIERVDTVGGGRAVAAHVAVVELGVAQLLVGVLQLVSLAEQTLNRVQIKKVPFPFTSSRLRLSHSNAFQINVFLPGTR